MKKCDMIVLLVKLHPSRMKRVIGNCSRKPTATAAHYHGQAQCTHYRAVQCALHSTIVEPYRSSDIWLMECKCLFKL